MCVPCGFAGFAIDPLYRSLILNGDDLADADFISGMINNSVFITPTRIFETPTFSELRIYDCMCGLQLFRCLQCVPSLSIAR